MSYLKSINVVSRKVASNSYPKNFHKRMLHVSKIKLKTVNLDIQFLPLPSAGTISHRNTLHKKKTESSSYKRFRYIGYSDFKPCVKAIDSHEAKKLDERLFNAAELYDGWFSRNVENLDLAPSISNSSR